MDKTVTIESEEFGGLLNDACVEFDLGGDGEARDELIAHIDERLNELADALQEYIDAGENSVNSDDDVSAMLRFAEAEDAAKAALKKARGE